jgi:hypothetical protein
VTSEAAWLREQLGHWQPALARGDGDLVIFWRRIWRLHWGGAQYCVKLPRTREETGQEATLLRALHSAGCPVPRVEWADGDAGLIVMEWVEGSSLEDVLKQPKSAERERALAECVQAFAHVREATAIIERVVEPGEPAVPEAPELAAILGGQVARLAPGADTEHTRGLTQALADMIWADPDRALGVVDVLPRDVLVARERVVFVDYWPVGWWWCEKRFCQYFARFQQDTVDRAYQSACFLEQFADSDPVRLDAHYLWHDLSYLDAWQEVRDSPEGSQLDADMVESIIGDARDRLTWRGECPAANELRDLLRQNLIY